MFRLGIRHRDHVEGAHACGQQGLVRIPQDGVHDAYSAHVDPYSGMLPCFLAGRGSRLFAQAFSALIRVGRVCCGSITSST